KPDAVPLLREAIKIHESLPADSLAGRDMIQLAWSYLRLGQAELEAGRRDEIPAIRRRLVTVLGAVRERSLVGFPLPNQSVEIARIEALGKPILAPGRDDDPGQAIRGGSASDPGHTIPRR
ncbi:hypothetical protein ACYOEI_30775, partial [Singulisphaera rosea]